MTRELHLSAIRARYNHEWCLTDAERERHIAVETARIMGRELPQTKVTEPELQPNLTNQRSI